MVRCTSFKRWMLLAGLSFSVFGWGLCEVENVPVKINNDDVVRDGQTLESLEFPLEVDSKSSNSDLSLDDNGETMPEMASDEHILSESSADLNEIADNKFQSETSEAVIGEERVESPDKEVETNELVDNSSGDETEDKIDKSSEVEGRESEEAGMESPEDLNPQTEEAVQSMIDTIENGTTANENMTISNTTQDHNTTTPTRPAIRWPCNPLTNISLEPFVNNDNESLNSSVIVINNETMLTNLISAMNRTKVCGLLLFYSPFCEFCTNLAPLYNAVGRSYRDILVIASDAQNVMGVSAKYGIVGIPTILLFHSGKAVAKYNRSRTSADFREFILQLTGVRPSISLNITQDDNLGPLTSTLKESRDYYLIFSIVFIIFVVLKGLAPLIKDSTIKVYRCVSTLLVRPKVE